MPDSKNKDSVTYYVNGEEETSPQSDLAVKQILEHAGFTPATDYTLKSENPKRDYDSQYDEIVKIHHNQRFQAQHKGPTPTS